MNEPSVTVTKYRDRANLVLCYRDPATGRLFTQSAGTADKRAAQKAAGVWESEITAGKWTPATRTRKNAKNKKPAADMGWDAFRLYFEENYRGVRKVVRPLTHAKNQSTLNAFEKHIKPKSLHDLNTTNVTAFVTKCRETYAGKGTPDANIGRHLRHLRLIARWANRQGLLADVPAFDMPKGIRRRKSRGITAGEFGGMIEATPGVMGEIAAESWRTLLRGLWWSGLRLGEAMTLTTEPRPGGCWVVLNGRNSYLVFDGDAQKNGETAEYPVAPEFVALLESMNLEGGYVFNPLGVKGYPLMREPDDIGKRIAKIGKAAGIVTNAKTGKHATAHDLRRSFGDRWSKRVMPPELKQLMRHATVETTLTYYAGSEAAATTSAIWDAANQQTFQHSTGDAADDCPEMEEKPQETRLH